MPPRSAGLLVYRWNDDRLEVLVAHMGGPFFARKDAGGWSIPKGEFEPGEEPLAAARREFEEETGSKAPEPPADGEYLRLPDVKQTNGKIVTTFAVEGDVDLSGFHSNTFHMEWPRGSGKLQEFPEMDRAEWFEVETAAVKVVRSQVAILDALREVLKPA